MVDDPDQQKQFAPGLRSFGRRRGRKLSPRQDLLLRELLPVVGVDVESPLLADPRRLFPEGIREIWLEIGFGGGEHLLSQARANPQVGMIGSEPFEDGVVKVLSAIAAEHLVNVRIHADDVRTLLHWLPARSVSRVFILFPDPWPKKRHRKRRLFNAATLDLLACIMQPGCELRAATDSGDYASAMLAAVAVHPAFEWTARGPRDWRERPGDWPETRYERKAIAADRRCSYLIFRRS